MAAFTDQKQRIATQKDCDASWSGVKGGQRFRCALCGHRFKVGDKWRFVYTNDMPGAGGNPLVCEKCDGTTEEVRQKWQLMCEEYKQKFWRFRQEA